MTEARAVPARKKLEVVEFAYKGDGHEYPVRLVMIDYEPWFVASDIVNVVRSQMMFVVMSGNGPDPDRVQIDPRRLVASRTALTASRGGDIWLISERAFYEAVHSGGVTADEAWAFKRWVTHEVLPTVRQLNPMSVRRTDLPVIQRTKVTFIRRGAPRPIRKRTETPQSLYRFFNSDQQLLYVGITWSVPQRTKSHRGKQSWWSQVASMRVETHPSRAAALIAEREAMLAEGPLYNSYSGKEG